MNLGQLFFEPEYSTSKGESLNQNIYITSDEEVAGLEGDFYIDGDLIRKGANGYKSYAPIRKYFKKIILTTDSELIKEGVQAIDDEFLEWFFKNRNYESVEIKTQHIDEFGNYIDDSFHSETDSYLYKIIIPKEEPEQDYSGVHFRHCYQGEYEDGCKYGEDNCPAKPKEEPKQDKLKELYLKNNPEKAVVIEQRVSDFMNQLKPKQETLEEVAERFFNKRAKEEGFENWTQIIVQQEWEFIESFPVEFAKWQQGRRYSDEEMYSALQKLRLVFKSGVKKWQEDFEFDLDKWFEQFKKK
jgi:hypothetical protein